MSVLRDRIVAQPGAGGPDHHPVGTGATPMTMPMAEITYTGAAALYGTLHPLVTADGAIIPARPQIASPYTSTRDAGLEQ